jgi:integrase
MRTLLKKQIDSSAVMKAWENACEAAGHPAKLFHDFRRTAVRNLERAGVPRSTAMAMAMAMAMVGHETESIHRRYAIVDESMHRDLRRFRCVVVSFERLATA